MAAKKKNRPPAASKRPVGPEPWFAAPTMVVLGVMAFATAISFDTSVQSTFDLPKLGFVHGSAAVLLVALAALAAVRGEFKMARTPFDGPVLATVLAAIVATALSVDWRCSLYGTYKTYGGLAQILALVVLFYAASRLRRREVIVVMGVILAAAVGASAYGLVQALGLDGLGWSKMTAGRELSTFGNPVFYGMYLGVAMPLALGLAFRGPRQGKSAAGLVAGWLAAFLGAALFVPKIYTMMQSYRGGDPLSSAERAMGLAVAALVLVTLLGYHALRRREVSWPAGLGWLMVVVALSLNAAAYTSRTVGALIAMFLSLIWFAGHMLWRRRDSFSSQRVMWLVVVVGLVVLNLGFNLWPRTTVSDRVALMIYKGIPQTSIASSQVPKRIGPGGSLYMRALLFRTGINIYLANPIFGVGPDAVERVVAEHWSVDYQLSSGKLVEVEGFENRLHNELLEIAATQGSAGVLARLWLYVAVLMLLWRGSRRLDDGEVPVLAGLGASWVFVTLANLVEYPTIPLAATSWTVLGCMVAWVANDDDEAAWPVRRLSLGRPNGLVVVAVILVMAGAMLLAWNEVVARPYESDKLFMQGQIKQRSKDLPGARDAYEQALALLPHLHVYRETVESVILAQANPLLAKNDRRSLQEREKLAEQIIELGEEGLLRASWRANGYSYLGLAKDMLADVLLAKGSDDAEQITALRAESFDLVAQAIEVNPHNSSLRGVYARQCFKHQKWDEFAAEMKAVLELWPRKKPILQLLNQAAGQHLNQGRTEMAIELIEPVRDIVRGSVAPDVFVILGRAYWVSRKWAELEELGGDLVVLAADNPEGYRYQAVAYVETGRLDEAETAVQRYVELATDKDSAEQLAKVIRARRQIAASSAAGG